MVERQELYCHDCGRYVQFDIDLELDGNHVLVCPNCGHEHCRVVKGGRITDIRWAQRNGPTIPVSQYAVTSSTTSTFTTYTQAGTGTARTDTASYTGSAFLYGSWMNTGTGNA